MAVRPRSTIAFGGELADLGTAFVHLHRRGARQERRVRQLAARADDLAMSRGIALVGRRKRQQAALEATREEVGYHAAWARWSSTFDELTVLAAQIGRRPASRVADLAIKFDALMWLLLDDGVVVDRQIARQVGLFGRELTRVAARFSDGSSRQ